MSTPLQNLYTYLPRFITRQLGVGQREHLRLIDLSAIQLLRQADVEKLCDPQFMEALFPQLGLCGGKMLYPAGLSHYMDTGLESMQMPNQFGPYIATLAPLSIRRYCEIGVKYGGTFVFTSEYLKRLGILEMACGIDVNFCPSIVKYSRMNPAVSFHQTSSTSDEGVRLLKSNHFDLVFVDGDHEENACYEDIVNAVRFAKHIAVHDISNDYTPGPGNAWKRMKEEFRDLFVFHEFDAQYPEMLAIHQHHVLGIGLAERKQSEG